MKNNKEHIEMSTKQKIIDCAVNIFAAKGFTETSVREIAAGVEIKAASLYFHFKMKSSILEYMLDDYIRYSRTTFKESDAFQKLQKNPSPSGIMDCLVLYFPDDKKDYYLKVLSVILQEQHRNPLIRDFISKEIILYNERNIKTVIRILQDLNIIRSDTTPDFWATASSSLFYAFANRMLLGIGDMSPDFTGIGMVDALRNLFELLFETCCVEAQEGSYGNNKICKK
jgi:AcrR family transcriptional regulator